MRNAARIAPPPRLSRKPERRLPRAYESAPPDAILFISVACLVAIGMVMVFSASSTTAYAVHHDVAYFFKRQLMWLGVGSLAAWAAFRIDYTKLRAYAPALFIATTLALIAVLVPHLGASVNGSRRWLGISSLSIQPSEFAKLTLVFFLAVRLADMGERVLSFSRGVVPLLGATFFVALLIQREPDMGTASIIVAIGFAMLFVAGARIPHLLGGILATAPVVVYSIFAHSYQRERILAFLNPWKDPLNYGFHIVQSLYALGSGGWWGVGLGASREKFFYLPEQYTDFIFSIVGEELGLIGTLTVVALFIIFATRAVKIAMRAEDRFGYFLALGCTALIVVQAFINIGVVTSSWPVTGVPLPFISFGGSALVVDLVAVALIANVGRRRRIGS
uniref:peptidoglycan glycosyltransferase n=1 Tax=mine drainage metagenome TaxID=410659 RepID=E6PGT7_9ZZZZ